MGLAYPFTNASTSLWKNYISKIDGWPSYRRRTT